MEKLIENIPYIVLILIIVYLCFRLWKAGKYRGRDNEIYESELRKKNKCLFDGNHCGVIERSDKKSCIPKICLHCPRYDRWLNKGLGENELREKINSYD